MFLKPPYVLWVLLPNVSSELLLCILLVVVLNVPIAHWVGCGKIDIASPTRRTPSKLIVVQRVDDHVGLASFSLVFVFVLASVLSLHVIQGHHRKQKMGSVPTGWCNPHDDCQGGSIPPYPTMCFMLSLGLGLGRKEERREERRREGTKDEKKRKSREKERGDEKREGRTRERKRGKKRRARRGLRSDTMWICLYYMVWI